tara:strand:+ start:1636 stop:1866 length:231 start_codon:yes stop_codon:yes gene_type:complete
MKKSITLLLIIIFVASCGNPRHKTKEDRRQYRDSIRKAEKLHPDTIIANRDRLWGRKKAHIDAKFDSLRAEKDTIR